ncbi:unnamed protein product [Symbiodinium sp. KB8]|nr:unnamed protein product [Symbiodinium sp. KB8]
MKSAVHAVSETPLDLSVLGKSESPVRTAVRVRSWSDATVIPCPEGIHQKHVEAPASSSSHGWQRARQLARTVNVMGHLLDDVRSKQTESVYSTDWTRKTLRAIAAPHLQWKATDFDRLEGKWDWAICSVIYQPSQASGKPDQILRSAVEIIASSEDARCVQLSFHPTHHAGQHYNSVRCCTDDGSGAAELISFGEIKRRIDETLRPKECAVSDEVEDGRAPKGDDSAGALESFLRSSDDAESPHLAEWPQDDLAEELRCNHCCPETEHAVKALSAALMGLQGNVSGWAYRLELRLLRCPPPVAGLQLQFLRADLPAAAAVLFPGMSLEIGAGTASLTCLAVSLQGTVRYQWFKDAVPLHRAERPRLVVSGTPGDEGVYTCTATTSSAAVSSSPCMLRLSQAAHTSRREEAARRARVQSPMRRAMGAVQLGQLSEAVKLLSEAILSASAENEAARAEALCLRSELRNQLCQWQDAFADANDALALIPSLARAHAARGEAAEQLGFLAEAASSWETAELLGGIPQAAARAEACRQKLEKFFAEQNARRQAPEGNSRADPEEGWRRHSVETGYKLGGCGIRLLATMPSMSIEVTKGVSR